MSSENLKDLPLDELLKLLATSQRNLTRAKLYNEGADVVQQNKNQLEKIQKAIVDKREDPLVQCLRLSKSAKAGDNSPVFVYIFFRKEVSTRWDILHSLTNTPANYYRPFTIKMAYNFFYIFRLERTNLAVIMI